MTVDLHPSTVEAARDRDGAAAEDRPEGITDALESEQLGYGEGEPLVGESYESYPSRAELSNPSQGEFLRDILSHPLVDGLDTAVEELTGVGDTPTLRKWLSTVEAAADAHGLDTDTLTAKGGDQGGEDTLTSLLGYEPPTDVVHRNNPVLITELYTLGLSVAEVADTLEPKVEGSVREDYVRDTLKTVGLLKGATREEQAEAFSDKDGRITQTSHDFSDTGDSSGLTINAEDFA